MITERKVFKYNKQTNVYSIDDKEVSQEEWIKAKSTWDTVCSYNHLKNYVDKYGFTTSNYDRTNSDIDIVTYTTNK